MKMQTLRRIYDFGMNIAEDTGYYLAKGYDVVAVEANPAACAAARERFAKEIDAGRLAILNKAVGEKLGVLPFYICNEVSARSTASPELVEQWTRAGETFKKIDVEFDSAGDMVREYGPAHYIKIDIEGHDLICLRQILETGSKPDYVSFEVDFHAYEEALTLCAVHGYSRFALVNQAGVPTTEDTIDGKPYAFHTGQTGKFGADLDEDWITLAALKQRLDRIRLEYRIATLLRRALSWSGPARKVQDIFVRRLPGIKGWYDVHAGKGPA